MKTCSCIAVVCFVALTSTAAVQAVPVPSDVLVSYEGEYSSACSDSKSLRAKVAKDGLTLMRGERRVVATFEMVALTYLGQSPPEGYETALMGNAKGLGSVVFIMYRGKSGPMVDLDTEPAVLKRLGIAKRGTVKYKKC